MGESAEFDTWMRAARKYAPALHLDADALVADHSVVVSTFGEEWLERERASLTRGRAFHEMHPMYSLLRSSAEAALVEVAEIATYVREFQGDPSFSDVLDHLRTAPDFRAASLELAMAFRWKRAGADVRLRPLLPTGKRADFAAVIEGVEYVVEVSSSPKELLNSEAAGYANLIVKTLRTAKSDSAHVAVEVVIDRRLRGDMHGAMQRAVREGLKSIGSAERAHFELAFGTVVVRRAPAVADDHGEGRWHHSQQLLLMEPTADGSVFEGHKQRIIGRGPAVYVRVPIDDRDLYSFLLSKYRKEVRQLWAVTNRVMLLDLSGVKRDVLTMDMGRINDSLGQILLQDEQTSAVWISSRGWSEYLRPMYRAITISNPAATHPLPRSFGDLAGDLEEGVDMLTGKPYDWLPTRRFEDPLA